jgi:hypothetical protein
VIVSDTAGLEMYRQRRSDLLRSYALTATPACSEKSATLPNTSNTSPCMSSGRDGNVKIRVDNFKSHEIMRL